MSSEWPVQRLDQIAEINPARKVRKGSVVPFVDMAALPQHSRDIGAEGVLVREAKGAGAHFQNGDTLLARITPCLENGKTAQVRCLDGDAIAEGSTEFIVLCGKDPEDNDFIYYLCREPAFREYAIGRMEGTSGRQRVSWQSIAAYEFAFPPPDERRAAACVLSALDDRITLLRETNATLEAIAQALFKSWFVDFDPVHAKARGEQPEALPEPLAALFPDSFEESPLGLVPRGWRVGVFADICARIESGGTPKRTVPEYWNGNVSWLTSGEVRNPIVFETRETISDLGMKESSAKLWPPGTTVVAMYGATAGEVCLVAKPMTANQACCGLIPNPHTRAFMYVCARRERESLASKSSGSAQQNLNKGLVESHPTVLPPDDLLRAYEDIAGVMLDGWIANAQQAHTLSTLRDTLLPRLISGQLRLPEAEAEALAA